MIFKESATLKVLLYEGRTNMIFIKSLGYEIIYVAVTFKLYIYYIYKALAKVYFVVMNILESDLLKQICI